MSQLKATDRFETERNNCKQKRVHLCEADQNSFCGEERGLGEIARISRSWILERHLDQKTRQPFILVFYELL